MNTRSNDPPSKAPAKATTDDTITHQAENTQPSSVHKPAFNLPAMFGKYKLLRLLAQGGMGTVFYAEDTQLNRVVAIKCPRVDRIDAATEARFAREARSAAQLNHPNICSIYDFGQYAGQPYYVMPYIEGTTLTQYLKKVRRLPERQIAGFLRKVARAVGEAHSKGIVHRDLKPGNIMINQRGEPIVLDFGLARDSRADDQHLTNTGAAIGTPAYMSPEQITGASSKYPIDCRSDIYSFGVIAYEMLTGQLPFKGDSFMAQIAQTLTATPESVRSIRPEISPAIDQICMRCLHRDIHSRFQSFDDVLFELNRFLQESKSDEQVARHSGPAQLETISYRAVPHKEPFDANVVSGLTREEKKPARGASGRLWAMILSSAAIALAGIIVVINNGGPDASDRPRVRVLGSEAKDATKFDANQLTEQRGETENQKSAVDLLTSGQWEWRVTGNLGHPINSSSPEDSADLTADGLTIVFSSGRPGGVGLHDVWVANRESKESLWSRAVNLDKVINTTEHEAVVSISANRELLAFSRSRNQERWQAVVAKSTGASNQWNSSEVLLDTVEHQQITDISSDGLTLIIQRIALSSSTSWTPDLFIARRPSVNSKWTDVASIGSQVNTDSAEGFGTLSDDGRMFIFTRGPNENSSDRDLWITTRSNWYANWIPPVPMDSLNTEYTESCPHLLPDGVTLLFSSDRPGGYGLRDIWSAQLTQKN